MPKLGTAALGLIGGLLLALVVQDLLATAWVQGGTIPQALAVVLGLLMPVLGVLGAVLALLLDSRHATRQRQDEGDRETATPRRPSDAGNEIG